MSDQRPASPPSRAVRMTRRQLARQEEELSKSQTLAAPPPPPEPTVEEISVDVPNQKQEQEESIAKTEEQDALEPQGSEITAGAEGTTEGAQELQIDTQELTQSIEATAPEVEITSEPEPKTLTSEKPCESEQATPTQSRTPSRTPSRSPAKSPMRLEESIEAIDALEEALENVIPSFDPSADEKSPKKAQFSPAARARLNNAVKRSPLAASKVSRNPSAPKSLKPTSAPKPSITRSSSLRTAPSKEARKGSGEVTDYLAQKRRPISMNFPTPPPIKSNKAPTMSTFQLSSEAVAAKLKAQKEERLKRQQEGAQRPVSATFAAPVVKSSKPPTKSIFQLPGEAIAAKLKARKEERLKREAEGATDRPDSTTFQPPPPPRSSKPPTVPNFQLPGEAVAAKLRAQREERQKREEEEAAKKATFKARPAPIQKGGPALVRQTAASKARENLMSSEKKENGLSRTGSINAGKRNSIISRPPPSTTPSSSSVNSNRNSMILNGAPAAKSTVTANDAAAQRLKGREIFNRDKIEKEQREKERREKEEAAKKARAEAAERGRIASREWAEKQRRKLMGGAAAPNTEAT